MQSFILTVPADEIVHLLRAEVAAEYGAPALTIAAEKEYIVEEDFDRVAYGLRDGLEYDLVTSITTLTVEPWVESGYWILETTIERSMGLLHQSHESQLSTRKLTLEEFGAELQAPVTQRVTVRLSVQTADVRQDFDRWLHEMRVRHPWKPKSVDARQWNAEHAGALARRVYCAKEIVGVFSDSTAVDLAIDQLEAAGFGRSTISVLATNARAKGDVNRAGGGVSALLAAAIGRRHAAGVREHLNSGALALCVRAPDENAERRALAVLERTGARDIHLHETNCEWRLRDIPG